VRAEPLGAAVALVRVSDWARVTCRARLVGIEEAFRRLGDRLAKRGVAADLLAMEALAARPRDALRPAARAVRQPVAAATRPESSLTNRRS
jgi:hypothetical protein